MSGQCRCSSAVNVFFMLFPGGLPCEVNPTKHYKTLHVVFIETEDKNFWKCITKLYPKKVGFVKFV